MSNGTTNNSEGISIQTLVIAAAASAAAALVTSFFWERGTLISATIFPVLVSVLRELLQKPVARASQVRGTVGQARAARRERRPVAAPQPATAGGPSLGQEVRGSGSAYRRLRLQRVNWRIALATAAVAFGIAALVLTVPELVAGQSAGAGERRTTLFGGASAAQESPGEREPGQFTPGSGTQPGGARRPAPGADRSGAPDRGGDRGSGQPKSQQPAPGESAPGGQPAPGQQPAPGGSQPAPEQPPPPSP